MPWFKIDDKAHSHPKWLRAGNAAVGLFVRAGSYSAQHLTEGIVPAAVAQLYGTAPQAAKLVKVGLWHDASHDCPRCPLPAPGDYVIHDFFEGGRNATRQQVEDARKRGAERQSKRREKQKAPRIEDENDSIRLRFDDESDPDRDGNESPFEADAQVRGHRHNVTPQRVSQPSSTSSSTSTGISYGDTSSPLPPIGPGPGLPPAVREEEAGPASIRPLVEAMHGQGMDVSWPLGPDERRQLAAQMAEVGVHALVEHAAKVWRAAKTTPYSARFFLPQWLALQPVPGGPPTGLHAVGGPSKTSAYLADMAAIADEMRQNGA